MKVSEQWLREWVDLSLSRQDLIKQLTMAGLEVDGVESVAAEFKDVVVAQVQSVKPHPDADKLKVCEVSNGKTVLQIVCGAQNVRAGLKVPLAQVGAQLPNLQINAAKVRGIESFGMLCSSQELGMTDSADGLLELPEDAPVGQCIREYLALDDVMIEVDLTPNRGDCLSVSGLARDIGVLTQSPLKALQDVRIPATIADVLPVKVSAIAACPRYVGRIIRNINVNAQTPIWMQEKLRRSGLRSIHPVVDVTNYVMIELGQPMHAFDLDKLQGGIDVRFAQTDEVLDLLDGQTVTLREDTLVIADDRNVLAVAGVMGGVASSVTQQTHHIFLESAFFSPIHIAGKARSYGLHTDSSHRFERGVDPQLQVKAVERATQLLLEIVGGEASQTIEVSSESHLPLLAQIELRATRIERVLGMSFGAQQVADILTRLGCTILSSRNDYWKVTAPSHRFDLAIEVDLIEELARVHGYNRLPMSSAQTDLKLQPKSESCLHLTQIRRHFLERGYQEAITYSFVDPKMQQRIEPHLDAVELANPISADMSVMRVSLWTGLLNALRYNQNRQQTRVRLFETGLRFIQTPTGLLQDRRIAAVVSGARNIEGWNQSSDHVDFFDIKGDVEALIQQLGRQGALRFVAAKHAALHPGQTAEIYLNDVVIGVVGALHPQLVADFDLLGPVYLFEADLASIENGNIFKFNELSKFPEVRRDIAVVVDELLNAQELIETIRKEAGQYLTNLTLFDVYQGKGIDPQRKSLAIGLTWQHTSRTLNDDEINAWVGKIMATLEQQFGATLRE